MTERQQRADEYGHRLELEQKRQQWEAQRRQQREQAERDRKQGKLEQYLSGRTQAWIDHTGTSPSLATLEGWRREYVDEREAERRREAEARKARSMAENADIYHSDA